MALGPRVGAIQAMKVDLGAEVGAIQAVKVDLGATMGAIQALKVDHGAEVGAIQASASKVDLGAGVDQKVEVAQVRLKNCQNMTMIIIMMIMKRMEMIMTKKMRKN